MNYKEYHKPEKGNVIQFLFKMEDTTTEKVIKGLYIWRTGTIIDIDTKRNIYNIHWRDDDSSTLKSLDEDTYYKGTCPEHEGKTTDNSNGNWRYPSMTDKEVAEVLLSIGTRLRL